MRWRNKEKTAKKKVEATLFCGSQEGERAVGVCHWEHWSQVRARTPKCRAQGNSRAW